MNGYPIKQSQTAQPLVFLMVDSADHLTGKTGLSPTVKISKNGAVGATPAGAVSEVDATNMPGWYRVAGNATDAGTLGPLLLHASASGADPTDARFDVVAYDPQATSLGLVLAKTTNLTGLNDIAATAVVSNGAITTSGGKAAATVASGDDADAASVKAAVGTAGAGLTNLGDARIANLNATVSSRSTFAGGAVASVTAAVTVATNNDKTGYLLGAAGLDAVAATDPGGVAGMTTFPTRLMGLFWRVFGSTEIARTSQYAGQFKKLASDDTVQYSQSVTYDGTTQTQGEAG